MKQTLPYLTSKYRPHFIIVNGENAAGGRGITAKIANEFFSWGIDAITMGNHTWDNKEIFNFIDDETRIVRPANFPQGTPGRGFIIIEKDGKKLAVINLMGRTFMNPLECPFVKAEEIIQHIQGKCNSILIDFHAEATSEKQALGWYLDGKVSVVLGTHTHVQTNDERILPGGTAYLTDVGMVGTEDSILGMEKEAVLRKFITQMPVRFQVANGKWMFHGLFIDIDEQTGKTKRIEKIRLLENDLMFL